MNLKQTIILAIFFALPNVLFIVSKQNTANAQSSIVMNLPGYPFMFELNKNDSILIDRTFDNKRITKTLVLKDFRLFTENNNWIDESLGKRNYYKAEVDILVSGKKFTIMLRSYQMPVTVEGLRIYIEAVKKMDEIPNMGSVSKMTKDVRFSVCLEHEPWGNPTELEFPVSDYRWRSASYNNTWFSLVPFNKLYYHRGEDLGAIPDRLVVRAWADGQIIRSPQPNGSTGSNSIGIKTKNGLEFYYSHCNIETIDSDILVGRNVKKGQYLARTGMTWNGEKSQNNDPHLHTELDYNGYQISTYPYFVEAYFRKYDDKVLAVAGGYRFANVGDSIELDATRSICRDNEKIASYQWKLHNGQIVNQPVVKIKYENSGYYSEELIVTTENGVVDKDFLQVRVNSSTQSTGVAHGWAYCYPTRDIKPGHKVLFWSRLINTTQANVSIDFGDGSPIQTITTGIYHSYSESGNYTVVLTSKGANNEPVTVKLEVIVDQLKDPNAPIITASNENVGMPASNVMDGLTSTNWKATPKPTVSAPHWLQLQYPTAQIFNSVKLTSCAYNYKEGYATSDPRDWTIEGSNDATSWTILDTQNFSTANPAYCWAVKGDETQHEVPKQFNFNNTTAYTYYRIKITDSNQSPASVMLSEIEFSSLSGSATVKNPDNKFNIYTQSGHVIIDGSDIRTDSSIKIFDIKGIEVASVKSDGNKQLSIGMKDKGIYIVQVKNAIDTYIQKLTIN
jgi:murein DD-endopeptidase MepM/ murein hydrolase activator NlpD